MNGRCQQCHESVAADAVAGEGSEAGDEGLLLGESWMDLTGPPAGASNRIDAVDRRCHKTTHELVEEHSKVCHSGRESCQVLAFHFPSVMLVTLLPHLSPFVQGFGPAFRTPPLITQPIKGSKPVSLAPAVTHPRGTTRLWRLWDRMAALAKALHILCASPAHCACSRYPLCIAPIPPPPAFPLLAHTSEHAQPPLHPPRV